MWTKCVIGKQNPSVYTSNAVFNAVDNNLLVIKIWFSAVVYYILNMHEIRQLFEAAVNDLTFKRLKWNPNS